MNKTLKTFAAGMLLASTALAPMAYAQTTAPANPSAPAMDAPATPATPGAADAQPVTPMAPAAGDSAAAETSDTYLTEQSETQVSANTYIGKNVYNAADEDIGTIADLIFEKDGGVVAAVVGVGGFLGIGQKNVAVPMDKITINTEADSGDIRLTTVETAESLEAAPAFMTLEEQTAAAGAETAPAMPTDNSTTSSTTNP